MSRNNTFKLKGNATERSYHSENKMKEETITVAFTKTHGA